MEVMAALVFVVRNTLRKAAPTAVMVAMVGAYTWLPMNPSIRWSTFGSLANFVQKVDKVVRVAT